jgi:hypothetical protein
MNWKMAHDQLNARPDPPRQFAGVELKVSGNKFETAMKAARGL